MRKKTTSRIIKGLKKLCSTFWYISLYLIFVLTFAKETKAKITPAYGIQPPKPKETLLKSLSFIIILPILLVISLLVGLIWYKKKQKNKKIFRIKKTSKPKLP